MIESNAVERHAGSRQLDRGELDKSKAFLGVHINLEDGRSVQPLRGKTLRHDPREEVSDLLLSRPYGDATRVDAARMSSARVIYGWLGVTL